MVCSAAIICGGNYWYFSEYYEITKIYLLVLRNKTDFKTDVLSDNDA